MVQFQQLTKEVSGHNTAMVPDVELSLLYVLPDINESVIVRLNA